MSEIIIKTRDDLHSILSKIYYGNEDEIWSPFEKCVWEIIQENQQLKESMLKSMLNSYNQGCKYTEVLYKDQLKQRDEVIDEAINHINSIYGWRKAHIDTSTIDVPLLTLCEELLETLQKCKGDNNE